MASLPKTFFLATYLYEDRGDLVGSSKIFTDVAELSAFLIAAVKGYWCEEVPDDPDYQEALARLSVESLLKCGGVVQFLALGEVQLRSSMMTPETLVAAAVAQLPKIGGYLHDPPFSHSPCYEMPAAPAGHALP